MYWFTAISAVLASQMTPVPQPVFAAPVVPPAFYEIVPDPNGRPEVLIAYYSYLYGISACELRETSNANLNSTRGL
jgi:hypothetical protein